MSTTVRTWRVRRSARRSGWGVESLRRWVQQALVDAGDQPGVTSNEKARIRELERENRDLRDANEILKAAPGFLAGTRPPTPLIVEFIDAQRRCGHRILLVCKVLGGLGCGLHRARLPQGAATPCVAADGRRRAGGRGVAGTRRPDPVTGQLPGERFYGRRKMTHWLRGQGFQVSFVRSTG